MLSFLKRRNSVFFQFLLFLLLLLLEMLGYVLVQITHLHLLYTNAFAISYLTLKFYLSPILLFVISITDEQLLGYPIGSLLVLNSVISIIVYTIKHRYMKGL